MLDSVNKANILYKHMYKYFLNSVNVESRYGGNSVRYSNIIIRAEDHKENEITKNSQSIEALNWNLRRRDYSRPVRKNTDKSECLC